MDEFGHSLARFTRTINGLQPVAVFLRYDKLRGNSDGTRRGRALSAIESYGPQRKVLRWCLGARDGPS